MSNTGELGTALQVNGGSNVGNLTGKNSAANNNLLFVKEKQSTGHKGKNAMKRQSMAINQPQGQECQEAAKHGNAGSILAHLGTVVQCVKAVAMEQAVKAMATGNLWEEKIPKNVNN